MTNARPGGRTARTKARTFAAAATLLAEKGPMSITMADIAERAGVAATSLYRRWGNVETLLREVAVERLMREWPLPDTGSLKGDLRAWAKSVARSLNSSDTSAFFRVFIATALPPAVDGPVRKAPISRRVEQIEMMLRRALARGESAPSIADVIDHLLAPLYTRALFGSPADEACAARLVKRLLEPGGRRRG